MFAGLQLLCTWLIVNQNSYQNFAFLSSSNKVAGEIQSVNSNVTDYFNLQDVNTKLMEENAKLHRSLSTNTPTRPSERTLFNSYQYIPAQVVYNSIRYNNNYLTLDKGSKHGIKAGMGVITSGGIVGKVKACSDNFSTVYSLLHADMEVSSELKRTKALCSTKWGNNDPFNADLLYLSRQARIAEGDTVVTSGNNAIFPPNTLIGIVESYERPKSETFMQAKIKLSTEFDQLDFVYVVKNRFSAEKDSLEKASEITIDQP